MFKRFAPWTEGNASFLRAARAGNLEKVLEYLKGSTDINTSNANGLNALHLASKEGHVNIVTELLKRGANVDAATKKGNTALHIASLAGQEEIVKILVQSDARVNVQSQSGFTPLYMAAQENHSEVVKFLLANGASQTLATEDGFTPLAVALQQGHDKVVAVLLENDARGKVRLPALHIAAKKDDVKAATLLLQNEHNVDSVSKSGGLVNDTTKSGFTPLHIASHYGNLNVATLLVDKGADVNFKARNNITPMHVASKWGRVNMVTLLLNSHANYDAQTRDGLTPLHCGARSGHDQVVSLLLEKGAPVASKTKNGLTPLHMAAQGDHVECARLLLYHKAPIDEVTVDYLTPLHVAAHCGNVRTAKLLLDKKCEVNARALNGFTPLHIACKKNRIKVVELLLKYGANIEATTESGLTPLHVASFMGHMNIVVYLIQHGCVVDKPTVRGETALHLAARANQVDIIRILLRNNANVDAKAREDQTPLHIAARLGNVDIVHMLLQHGANPDAPTRDMYTPLHIAAKEGQEEVASVLLEHGASLNLTTKKGFTPLHIAAKYGNIKVAQLLLNKKADPDVQGKNGLTPLHVATHYNHVNVALLLLDKKASPHCTAKNGYTPLHIAAKKNQMDIATTLLEYGAKPNAESKNGFTPLHLASQEGHTDMVSLLLEHKGDVNCRAKNGLTPMHLAAQEDKVPVAEILVKYGSEIDPQTKAGYTPLHTACHFGQINMIRFLLEHGASVNTTTKLGYTPLHQAAQQGHVLVINLLLKYKASPNAVSNTGQTPLSIAQRLGYISVVEILKHITEVEATTPATTDEKYKVVSPETMQEALMTDSEDEGGEDTLLGDASYSYLSTDDMKLLADDSVSPTIKEHDDMMKYVERYSTSSSIGDHDELHYMHDDSYPEVMLQEEQMMQTKAAPQTYATKKTITTEETTIIRQDPYGNSYSGTTFSSTFDPDNVALERHPVTSGFLVSFMVDARGGAMRGCRHSGVRIIIPPGKACMPTRVTCKLVKKEKLTHPPPQMEGEALASRILEMGPVGAKFLGPVIIEIPHFASLRGREREIVILRSDDGEHWSEHVMDASEEAIHDALQGSFEDLESAEELYHRRITRILTTDFPQYFAVITRIRQEANQIGPEGGMISSTVVPQVQAVFPEGSLTKSIKVGLQAQPIPPELVSKMLGNRVAVSPIVTVEPRRRKFHKPITLTIPVPKASQKGMINQYGGDAPTLRLLCSITGGILPAQWEDITGTTPLSFVDDCVSFTTTVSARFWLMDCQNIAEAAKMATELYRDATAVPFMSKFVVFSKRHDPLEARLRVFCMTDDKMEKTLENQEHFTEVARSKDVEVLEGKPQYVEMAGNLIPVTKSGEQLFINFHAFRENRLPFIVRTRDSNQEAVGRIAFMKEPKVARGEAPQTPICNLNIRLPDTLRGEHVLEGGPEDAEELRRRYEAMRGGGEVVDEHISKAELRLTDIADTLQGDWVILARQLDIDEEEIAKIQSQYPYVSEQALVMLHVWVEKNRGQATGNELERALRKIGREDVIRKCMYNIETVTDEHERAMAKVQIDHEEKDFDQLKEELGPSRDSSMHRGASLDVSYDEQDIVKESESAEEESAGSESGSIVENRDYGGKKRVGRPDSITEETLVPQVDERRGVLKSPTAEEEAKASRDKAEAFVAFAKHMEDQVEIRAVVEPMEEPDKTAVEEAAITPTQQKSPVEDLVQKAEALKEEGMDDRVSLSSEDSLLAAKEEKTEPELTEAQLASRLAEEKIQPTAAAPAQTEPGAQELQGVEAAPELAPTDKWAAELRAEPGAEVQQQVPAYQQAAPEPTQTIPEVPPHEHHEVHREVTETEGTPTEEVDEAEQVTDYGTVIKKRIKTIRHVKTITERITRDGVLSIETRQVPAGTEVEEEITEMPLGVDDPYAENCESESSYNETEETLPDGTWLIKRVRNTTVTLIPQEAPAPDQYFEPTPAPGMVTTEQFPVDLMGQSPYAPEDRYQPESPKETAPGVDYERLETAPTQHIDDLAAAQTQVAPSEELVQPAATHAEEAPVEYELISSEPSDKFEEAAPSAAQLSPAEELTAPVGKEEEPSDISQEVPSAPAEQFGEIPGEQAPVSPIITEAFPDEARLPAEQVAEPIVDEGAPEGEVEELEDMLPDGTVMKRRIITQRFDNYIVKRIITEFPSGEIREETFTEDIPDTDVTKPHMEEVPYGQIPTSTEDRPVISGTEPGEPMTELFGAPEGEYEEIEETLPDGTILRKRIMRPQVTRVVTKKIRRVGPDGEVIEEEVTEEMPEGAGVTDFPDLQEGLALGTVQPGDVGEAEASTVRVYTDTIEGEPQTETDYEEFEETLPDGTIVKRKVIKTRQKQTIVKRVVMEGPEGEMPTTDDQTQALLAQQLPETEMKLYADKVEGAPETSTDVQEYEETLEDGTVVKRTVVTKTAQQLVTERMVMEGAEQVPGMVEEAPSEEQVAVEDAPAAWRETDETGFVQREVTKVSYEEEQPPSQEPVPVEDVRGSPSPSTSEGSDFEDAQDGTDEAAGGEDDMQTTRVVMKKQIHKKTIIKDGKEETIVTEDTHVEQDNEGPEELRESMQQIIDQFMEGDKGPADTKALPESDKDKS